MNVVTTDLEGVVIIEPRIFSDARGSFFESYHAERYAAAGLPPRFVQDNHSCSTPGTLRGLHYQLRRPQGKLLRAVRGSIFDVAVDIRRGSPTFGRWVGVTLSAENKRQLYVPPGYAHGYCVPEETSEVEYKCTDFYAPEDEHGIAWNDPTVAIAWPLTNPILSERDRAYQPLSAGRDDLPEYRGPNR
jgi:dTDP-4-dehydrorhamnose 3,5-epimerase